MIQKLQLQLLILKLQLEVKLLRRKKTIPNLSGPKHIVIHHGGGSWSFNQVNNSHKTWKRKDGTIIPGFKSSLGFWCGYHYFIEYSGRVYQARQDNEEGAHCVGKTPRYWNRNSIGICLQGNTEKEQATEFQLRELAKLLDKKKEEYGITDKEIYGHREIQNTLCPGRHLWKWLIKNYPS